MKIEAIHKISLFLVIISLGSIIATLDNGDAFEALLNQNTSFNWTLGQQGKQIGFTTNAQGVKQVVYGSLSAPDFQATTWKLQSFPPGYYYIISEATGQYVCVSQEQSNNCNQNGNSHQTLTLTPQQTAIGNVFCAFQGSYIFNQFAQPEFQLGVAIVGYQSVNYNASMVPVCYDYTCGNSNASTSFAALTISKACTTFLETSSSNNMLKEEEDNF